MTAPEFTVAALESLGARVTTRPDGLHVCTLNSQEEILSTSETQPDDKRIVHYAPGTPAFDRLVSRLTQSGTHDIQDIDVDAREDSRAIVQTWLEEFGASLKGVRVMSVTRCFGGTALVQARSTVAHDAYERLVEIPCSADEHRLNRRSKGLVPVGDVIEKVSDIGLDESRLKHALLLDPGIMEFRRFYLERREEEVRSAAGDTRKAKKLEEDFTPRLAATVVGIKGTLHRELTLRVSYVIDGEATYESDLIVAPAAGGLVSVPDLGLCSESERSVPVECLARCEITDSTVLRHLLVESAESSRLARPSHTVICAKSGKRLLEDETAISSVTGLKAARSLLSMSPVSGHFAEPEFCRACSFTGAALLPGEEAISQISGKVYRADQQARSAVSGKIGHSSELILCTETRQLLAPEEGECCASTSKIVVPGTLDKCSISGLRVLPSELERSAVSGRKALRKHLISSSLSGARLLDDEAIYSSTGSACTPSEANQCDWSDEIFHPDDFVICELTGLSIASRFMTTKSPVRLRALSELLNGTDHSKDKSEIWSHIAKRASDKVHGSCRIEHARLSPNGRQIAVSAEVKTMFGFWVQHIGFISALDSDQIRGRVAVGKRSSGTWKPS